MKICSKCNEEKDDIEFTKKTRAKDGLHYECKDCVKKRYAYKVEKYDQWLSITKRAKKENAIFNIGQDRFYNYVESNKKEFSILADQNLTPYVTRKDETSPFTLDNLKIVGKPRPVTDIIAIQKDTNETFDFPSICAAAAHMRIGKKQIIKAIANNTIYKDYHWRKKDG